mgnify:CR=1 FL=1
MNRFEDSEDTGTENRENRRFGDNRRNDGFSRGFRGDRFGPRRDNFGPVEKRKAICIDCKKECEVYAYLKGDVRCTTCYRKFKGF